MKINAVFCKDCHNIIYSRHRLDYRKCDCGKCFIDGGFEYTRTSLNDEAVHIQLDSDVVVEQILNYDYLLGAKNVIEEGCHGKYVIREGSYKKFYRDLIVD